METKLNLDVLNSWIVTQESYKQKIREFKGSGYKTVEIKNPDEKIATKIRARVKYEWDIRKISTKSCTCALNNPEKASMKRDFENYV